MIHLRTNPIKICIQKAESYFSQLHIQLCVKLSTNSSEHSKQYHKARSILERERERERESLIKSQGIDIGRRQKHPRHRPWRFGPAIPSSGVVHFLVRLNGFKPSEREGTSREI